MSISRKQFRKPLNDGRWEIGTKDIPSEILTELGRALAVWGLLEQQMDVLLSLAIGNTAIGKVIRAQARTQRQRLGILKALVEETTVVEAREATLRLLGDFNSLSAERGLFAHGAWGRHTGHPDEAILIMDDALIEHAERDWFSDLTDAYDPVERVHRRMALVSVADLRRFHDAADSLTGEVIMATVEMRRPQLMKAIRARRES